MKLLALLLLVSISASVASGQLAPLEKPFYRKGETVIFSLDKQPNPMNTRLTDGHGRNVTLTWNSVGGRFSATYTLAPQDPAGAWKLIVDGGSEVFPFYVVDLYHTFLGAATAAGISLVSALLRRFTTDVVKARKMRIELSEFQREMRGALKSKDKGKVDKLKKREAYIKKMQAEQSKDQLRFMGITLVPFLLVYYALIGLVGAATIVAYSPVPIPVLFFVIEPPLTIVWWYIMSSFALGTVFTKLLGVGLD